MTRDEQIIAHYKEGLSFTAIGEKIGVTRNVVAGVVRRAGISDRGPITGNPLINLKGRRFGKWTVLQRGATNKFNHVYWECVCDCGRRRDVNAQSLRSGRSKSCGCGPNRRNASRAMEMA